MSHVRGGATGDKGIRSGVGAGTIATTQGDNVRMGATVIVEVGSTVVGLLRDWAICILHQGARWPCGHRHGHGTGEGGEERRGGKEGQVGMHRKNLESFVVIRSKDVVVVVEYFLCILTACKCGRFRTGRSIDEGRELNGYIGSRRITI